MTPRQISIIEYTFACALKQREATGVLFYRRLFAMAPELRSMFCTDMTGQARKLVDVLAAAVASLSDLPSLSGTLEALGQRHVAYGVRHEHYLYVGAALIGTLEECLGPAFDREARDAWSALYGTVSRAMRNAPDASGTAAAPHRLASA